MESPFVVPAHLQEEAKTFEESYKYKKFSCAAARQACLMSEINEEHVQAYVSSYVRFLMPVLKKYIYVYFTLKWH